MPVAGNGPRSSSAGPSYSAAASGVSASTGTFVRMFKRGGVFKRRGILTRGERLALLAGVPFGLTILSVEVGRVWRALEGEPLLITGLFGSDISVRWSVGALPFILGMIFHAALVAFVSAAPWFQVQQARRWFRAARNLQFNVRNGS